MEMMLPFVRVPGPFSDLDLTHSANKLAATLLRRMMQVGPESMSSGLGESTRGQDGCLANTKVIPRPQVTSHNVTASRKQSVASDWPVILKLFLDSVCALVDRHAVRL